MTTPLSGRRTLLTLPLAFALHVFNSAAPSLAGNEANFVLYDWHTARKGSVEIMNMTDFSTDVKGEPSYISNMLEVEYGVTDWWTFEFMAEGQQTEGADFVNTGFRIENRFRLMPYGSFLNPVLYTEYESLKPETKYLMEVSGRTDAPAATGPERDERIFETRLILGQDLTDRLGVSFNWINETDTRNGDTAFGYATGLNYTIFTSHTEHAASNLPSAHTHHGDGEPSDPWALSHVQVGAEFFGGVGDTVRGVTFDPDKTEQYAGLNVMTHFESGLHLMLGGAVGLTDTSQDRLIRLMVGWELE